MEYLDKSGLEHIATKIIKSDSTVIKIVTLTLEEYNALTTKENNVIYCIIDDDNTTYTDGDEVSY